MSTASAIVTTATRVSKREQAVPGRNFVVCGLVKCLDQGQPWLGTSPGGRACIRLRPPWCQHSNLYFRAGSAAKARRASRRLLSACSVWLWTNFGMQTPLKFQGHLFAGATLVPDHDVPTRGTLLTTFTSWSTFRPSLYFNPPATTVQVSQTRCLEPCPIAGPPWTLGDTRI